jgi:two-component system alkaline phosphatase synthesis response regulator PhoP
MTRILVVEDEPDIALGLRANLEIEGFEVDVAVEGALAIGLASEHRPDLIVLDLMLPDMSGFDVLARVRERDASVPVLILSARAEELDKVRGFRIGADDYVTKPFGVLELLLRVKALLRRSRGGTEVAPHAEQIGETAVDVGRRILVRRGVEIPVSPRAFDLLLALVAKRDQVLTRHELLREVWGYSSDVTTRTVDAHVAELRRKIEEIPSEPRYLLTVWKRGYRLRAEPPG